MKFKRGLILLLTTLAFTTPVLANNITIEIDGQYISTDTAPQIINGRTMVPVRAISESLGCTVNWLSETKTISINTLNNIDYDNLDTDTKGVLVDIAERKAIDEIDVNTDYTRWISGVGNFEKFDVPRSELNSNVKIIGESKIPGYVQVYAFVDYSISGFYNMKYLVDEMTEEFMQAENATGTFNGIRMKKENGILFFSYDDLTNLGLYP